MKFGVVVFPGSNCDEDMVYALQKIMGQETVKLWHKNTSLEGCDAIILPGGFSYGDYLRSGAIARFSPIMESVVENKHEIEKVDLEIPELEIDRGEKRFTFADFKKIKQNV